MTFFNPISSKATAQISLSFLANLRLLFPAILTTLVNGERVIKVTPSQLVPLRTFLKEHTGTSFSQLRDVTALDAPERKRRFEVSYNLLSLQTAQRLTVVTSVAEGENLPSVVSIFPSAGWCEREVWDRFGVFFTGHPDRRRLLTSYGFKGHPLRKDFPLTGYIEIRYDERRKRVIHEPVSLTQEFRQFTLESPWGASLLKFLSPSSSWPRTAPFQGVNAGSNPVGDTTPYKESSPKIFCF
jgi:NADH-quinone oxidoreductase subunit C